MELANKFVNRLPNGVIEIDESIETTIVSQKVKKVPIFDVSVCAFFGQGQKKSGVEEGPYHLCELVNSAFGIKKYGLVAPNVKRIIHGDDTNSQDLDIFINGAFKHGLSEFAKSVDSDESVVASNDSNNSNNINGWKRDYQILYEYLCTKDKYLLLGGDHSVGNPSVFASIFKTSDVNNLYVIWIDAHADANTLEASVSKNIHGTPLSSVIKWEEPWFPIKEYLPTTNLLYFGIRDLDEFEKVKIAEHNIFNTRNLQEMLAKLDHVIKNNSKARFHVSFDVDALDSSIMTATGCVVDEGLFPHEVASVINFVKSQLIAFDLVEFNPSLGDKDKSFESVKAIIDEVAK